MRNASTKVKLVSIAYEKEDKEEREKKIPDSVRGGERDREIVKMKER